MARRKREEYTLYKHLKALTHRYVQRMQQGDNITIISLLEELLNSLMLAQRKLYFSLDTDNYANGFYDRDLKLTMGNLKVPIVRFGDSFRPSFCLRNGKGLIRTMRT